MRNILNTLQSAQRAEKRNSDRINREGKMKKSRLVWIPRAILILLTAFISLFSFDVFEGNASLVEKLLALLIHLIPSFIMVAILLIAWIKPRLGGILCSIFAVTVGILLRVWNVFINKGPVNIFGLVFVIIMLITGIMFIVFGKTNQATPESTAS